MVERLPTAVPIGAVLATLELESTMSVGPSVDTASPISRPLMKTLWEPCGLLAETIPVMVTFPEPSVVTPSVTTLFAKVAGALVKVSL